MDDSELSKLTIGFLLDRQAERFGDRNFVAYPDGATHATYRQFRDRVNLVARGLMALGVRKGEHVAVWAPNVVEWLFLQYATAKIGAVLVPVNIACRAAELEYVLANSETTTLFLGAGAVGVDYVAELRAVLPDVDAAPVGHGRFENLPRLQRLIFMGRARLPGMLRFDDLSDLAVQTHPDDFRRRSEALATFEVINLHYTSGTTAYPKGVMLTHRNIILNGWHVTGRLRLAETDSVCLPIPLCHSFGATGGSVGTMLRGATLVLVDPIEPGSVLDAVSRERCTAMYGAPATFSALLEHPELRSHDLSSLRTGVIGAAPVPTFLAQAIIDRMGVSELAVAYGLTEASPVVTQTSTDDPMDKRVGTAGKALPGVQIKSVDPKTGANVPAGTEGELCCRGHGVMKGYFKDPESTAEIIDAEGWLHTRDLATIDPDGYVKLVGRLRDTIVRDGEKIYPREIEAFLFSHPKVADVHIIGVPNRKSGEDVCAAIKPKPGETIDRDEIAAFCQGRMQDHKVPTLVMVVKDYPLTAGGKVSKHALRQIAIEKFGRQEDAALATA